MRSGWLFILIGFNVIWSGTYSAFKDLKHWLDPGQVVTMRISLASLLLILCWRWLPGKAPRGRDLLMTCLMGLLVFVVTPRLQVMATQAGQAGDMSVLVALEPLVITLAAALFLRERVPLTRWIGFLFGMIGVILLSNIWQPGFRLASLGANLMFISSFFCGAAFSVMGKPLIERAGFLKVITLALAAGALMNLALDGPSTVVVARQMPVHAWLEIGYLSTLCTAIGFAVWFAAMRVLPVNAMAMTIFVQPFAGTVIAIWLLGEQPHLGQLWGGLAIATGLVLGLRQAKPNSQDVLASQDTLSLVIPD
jgi:drug/metabolite transporter (DMT)-like permease